jgi:acylphosphatase
VRISGRVQGVGFRWFVREEARRLGLSGWVANLPSGEVEVNAGGERSSVERLRRALQVGPSGAQVEGVEDVTGDSAAALPYPFNIRR